MTDIGLLTKLMKSFYNAEVLDESEAARWTDEKEKLIIGYRFPDKKKNYYLLTVNDLALLRDSEKEKYLVAREYPFDNIKAIIYREEDGEIYLRIVNGIGSALGNAFGAWKRWDTV